MTSGLRGRTASGLAFALVAALSFGLSGTLARGLIDAGWTPGAAVLARVSVAAVVLAPFAALALHRRWRALLRQWPLVVAYGVVAVAACQLCYFIAITHISVGIALLIEYTSPIAVMVYLWLRHGHRPGLVTLLGAALSLAGLVVVLDVFAGVSVNWPGVLWALGAMVGGAVYFVLSATDDDDVPPLALAGGGLLIGAVVLGLAGLVGVVPMRFAARPGTLGGVALPWWLIAGLLGVVTAAVAYSTGIAATRRLGARVSSFVSLAEVLAAMSFAALLLGEVPRPVQLLGAVLIVGGVVLVKLGERAVAAEQLEPMAQGPHEPSDAA